MAVDVAVPAAELAGELRRGDEAVAEGQDVGLEGADAFARLDRYAFEPILSVGGDGPRSPENRHAAGAQQREKAGALRHEPRSAAESSRGGSPFAERGRGGLDHGRDLDAGAGQLDGELEVERPVAGDDDPPAGTDAVGPRQGLRRARGHDAGQGPARDRDRALEGSRREDEALAAHGPLAALVEHPDLVRPEGRPDDGLLPEADARLARRPAAGDALPRTGGRAGRRARGGRRPRA